MRSRMNITKIYSNFIGFTCLAVPLCLLTGCGGEKFVSVEGKVTLDGVPLAYKSLLFTPEPGTPGNGAGGYTNGEGKYSLIAVVYGLTHDQKGVRPGRYRVTISEPLIPISEADFAPPLEVDDDPAAAGFILDPRSPSQESIPSDYSSVETTPLVLEVPESGGMLDLELASNP